MDVQPRQPQHYASGNTPIVEPKQSMSGHEPVQAPAVAPEPTTPDIAQTKPFPAEIVESPAESEPSTPSKAGLSPELLAQAEAETKQQEEAKQALLAARKSHKNRGPIVASILAVVVALSLAGIAVYAYMSQNEADEPKRPTQETRSNDQTNSSGTSQPATAAEVEGLAKELDATISATDESQEIPGDSLDAGLIGL